VPLTSQNDPTLRPSSFKLCSNTYGTQQNSIRQYVIQLPEYFKPFSFFFLWNLLRRFLLLVWSPNWLSLDLELYRLSISPLRLSTVLTIFRILFSLLSLNWYSGLDQNWLNFPFWMIDFNHPLYLMDLPHLIF